MISSGVLVFRTVPALCASVTTSLALSLLMFSFAHEVRASDAGVIDEEPYVSPFDEPTPPVDGEPYESPFDAPASDVNARDRSDDQPLDRVDAIVLEAVTFENREYFREETIRTFVTHPVPGRLDMAVLEHDRATIEGRYKDRGYLAATVALRVDVGSSPLTRKGVFVVTAGRRATIRSVAVHGNRAVSDKQLLKGMFTQPRTFSGAFGDIVVAVSRSGFYHKPFLDQDIQVLLKNYYAEGYLEARVDDIRTRAGIDREGIEVDVDVTEGAYYELSALIPEGDLPPGMRVDEARALFSVVDGGKADLVSVQVDSEALLNGWRRAGHPFAKVEQAFDVVDPPSGDPDHKGVVLRLVIDKGKAARIRKIHIVGNQGLVYGTMDHVIRRDIVIEEGALYNLDLIEKSKRQIQSTGFFSLVETRTVPVDETAEGGALTVDGEARETPVLDDGYAFVDLEVKVTEQPTWLLSLAPAFVASEGPLLIGIVGDRNVAGSGISSILIGTLSFQRQVFDFSVVEPRLLDTRIMLSGEMHRRQINYPDFMFVSDFGGGARITFPAFFDVLLSAGLTVEWGGVRNYSDTKDYDFVQFAESELMPMHKLRNLIEIGGTIDKRDNVLQPRNGYFLSGTLTYGGPYTFSAVHAMRAEGNARFFYTPFFDVTFKSNTRVAGVANPHGGPVPVTDRIYLGGFGSVRGYFPRSITPTLELPTNEGGLARARVGGTKSFIQNLEVEAPIFAGTPFRGFAFVDAGNTWSETDPMFTLIGEGLDRGAQLPLGLFWSVGLGVLIQTPLLPFRLEWSFPLTRRLGVDTRPTDFFLGVGSAF